jgi:hypothetical protein
VAEDLAFEEGFRNRRAIDADEQEDRARAELMDRLRHELLAGARFSGDEHGRRGRRRLLDHLVDLAHLRAVADERSERAVLAAGATSAFTSRIVSRRSTILSRRIFSRWMSTGFVR